MGELLLFHTALQSGQLSRVTILLDNTWNPIISTKNDIAGL